VKVKSGEPKDCWSLWLVALWEAFFVSEALVETWSTWATIRFLYFVLLHFGSEGKGHRKFYQQRIAIHVHYLTSGSK
jgi:hypothetical protein